jgi:hypothetical protein
MATSAESRPAPGWKLVDPGGGAIQTRIHRLSPLGKALTSMLPPTRSRLVTETDIVAALRQCNMIKTKSFPV